MNEKKGLVEMKKICVMALIGTLVFSGVSVVPAAAVSAETVQEAVEEPVQTSEEEEAVSVISSPGCTCQDGDDIYYAYEMQGLRLGIMKYNTKTGEKTEVYSDEIGESDSNGFYQLSVDEKYIYDTDSGKYSPYTKEEQAILKALVS